MVKIFSGKQGKWAVDQHSLSQVPSWSALYYGKLGYKCFLLLLPCSSATWLCISSYQDVESIGLPLESRLGHVIWLDQWTSVRLMQWRLERCLITESCPLPAFTTEPSCEEVWDKRDMCPIWVSLKSTSLLISRHINVFILDHPAPSWPYTHKWVQQISVKPPSQLNLNKIVISRPLSLLCSQS